MSHVLGFRGVIKTKLCQAVIHQKRLVSIPSSVTDTGALLHILLSLTRMQSCHAVWVVAGCAQFLLGSHVVTSTPFNPHVPDQKQPWFEGWYTRITSDSALSFAAVTGSFPDQELPYSTAFAGVLSQLETSGPKGYQTFPPDLLVTGPYGQPVRQQPDQLSKADFALQATDQAFNFSIDGLSFNMCAAVGGSLLTAQGTGSPLTWGPNPGDSPEGTTSNQISQHVHQSTIMWTWFLTHSPQ